MGIYKRGDNWYIDYYFEGNRLREMVGQNKKLAETVLAKRKIEIAEGKFLDKRKEPPKISFIEMADKYLEWSRVNKAKGSAQNDYYSLRRFKEHFNGRKLSEISSFLIEGYKRRRCEDVSQRTVDIDLACLKHLFTKAIEWGYAKENPAKNVKYFNPQNARLRYLSDEEIVKFVAACEDYFRPVALVAIHMGMRRGEILNLKWENIDFQNGIIHVEKTKNKVRRDVPMSRTVAAELLKLKQDSASEWVFVHENDRKKQLRDVRKPFARACRTAGITSFRFHDMRHTCASHLVMKGVDLRTVQEILGHKDFRMTLRYSHLSPLHRSKAVQVMDTIGHPLDTRPFEAKVLELKNANNINYLGQ